MPFKPTTAKKHELAKQHLFNRLGVRCGYWPQRSLSYDNSSVRDEIAPSPCNDALKDYGIQVWENIIKPKRHPESPPSIRWKDEATVSFPSCLRRGSPPPPPSPLPRASIVTTAMIANTSLRNQSRNESLALGGGLMRHCWVPICDGVNTTSLKHSEKRDFAFVVTRIPTSPGRMKLYVLASFCGMLQVRNSERIPCPSTVKKGRQGSQEKQYLVEFWFHFKSLIKTH